ncbi:MAG TPA: hypothetical protein VGJ11_06460 [Gaiellales bacterium]
MRPKLWAASSKRSAACRANASCATHSSAISRRAAAVPPTAWTRQAGSRSAAVWKPSSPESPS